MIGASQAGAKSALDGMSALINWVFDRHFDPIYVSLLASRWAAAVPIQGNASTFDRTDCTNYYSQLALLRRRCSTLLASV